MRKPMVAGERHGKLVALRPRLPGERKGCWLFRCDCGAEKLTRTPEVRNGKNVSCGCVHRQQLGDRSRTHGRCRTYEWILWRNIRIRCYNPKYRGYSIYGGRGIRVCDRWLESFENFLADVGERPDPSLTFDRIDVNGHYEPGNVRWATPREQRLNQRRMLKP